MLGRRLLAVPPFSRPCPALLMYRLRLRFSLAALFIGVLFSGCIPYGVGTTARPAPAGELHSTSILSFVPGVELEEVDESGDEAYGARIPYLDNEVRYGIDERADIGIRLTSFSGIVINYKRLLTPPENLNAPAVALMGGLGFLNFGNHLHGELTLIVSGGETGQITPYGGLRAMQVLPISPGVPSDKPTMGGFAGLRLGSVELGISPEVGVFYDPSALGVRETDVIVIPTVTLHGRGLIGRLFRR